MISILAYHGSNAEFENFDMSKSRDGAHFFTQDKSHAASFGIVRAYQIEIQNPMEISQDDLEAEWDKEHPSGTQDDRYLLPRNFVDVFVKQAKEAGCDGLVIRDMSDRDIEADMYLPFSPGQIKHTGEVDEPVLAVIRERSLMA